MKKASNLLFPNFNRQTLNKAAPFLSRNYIPHYPPSALSSPSSLHSNGSRLQSSAKTHGLIFKLRKFQTNPSWSSSPRERSHLEEAFGSAQTSEEMLRAFKDMEMQCCFDEKELGFKLHREGKDPEKVLFWHKSFENFGSRWWTDRLLVRSVFLGESREEFVVPPEVTEETNFHLKKSLEIKEIILDKDCKESEYKELGAGYRGLAKAYISFLNFKEALPFCLKALEIHTKELGLDSLEVAHDRRILGDIYCEMEEYEKAMEQHKLSQKVLRNRGFSYVWLCCEINVADMQIAFGKYGEAISTLKDIVQLPEKESDQAQVFISMGNALCHQGKFAESKRYLEIACEILEKKDTVSPIENYMVYSVMSGIYERMNEFETAISLLNRTLPFFEGKHEEGRILGRIGKLNLNRGEVQLEITYLESATEKLKKMFGPHDAESIKTCQDLSLAYSAMGNYTLAIEIQERVINTWKRHHGARAEDELREAKRILEDIKTKALSTSHHGDQIEALP